MKNSQHLQFLHKLLDIRNQQISLSPSFDSDDKQARFDALQAEYHHVENEMISYMPNEFAKSDMFLEHEGTEFHFYDVENFKNAIEVRCTNPEHFEQFSYDVADLIVH